MQTSNDSFRRRKLDLSLYFVTGRELLPAGSDFYESLEQAIIGGASIVQLREKNTDTGEFIEIAQRTKEICDAHNIPLLINDRIDVALAVRADGVHIGQSDMPVHLARNLLPKDSIIGLSVNDETQAILAAQENIVDYVGVGPVWNTLSKQLTSPVLGPRRVGHILERLSSSGIPAVAIGGINASNALRTLHGGVASHSGQTLAGIAVISAIMASKAPQSSARVLKSIVQAFHHQHRSGDPHVFSSSLKVENILQKASELITRLRDRSPIIHQITNNVTVNQLANTTIALGGSPIMAIASEEMEDLSKIAGALLINIGTIRDKASMLLAGKFANLNGKPIVFDPVGIGATSFRKQIGEELLDYWQATVIKGNAAEIGALVNSKEVVSRGVDSAGYGFNDPKAIVSGLARSERCIIVMTGRDDYIADGNLTLKLSNGDKLLSSITGSGCMVGAAVASFCGAASLHGSTERSENEAREMALVRGDMLTAAVAGVLAITIASEQAASRIGVQGPASFLNALIDELYNLQGEDLYHKAKIELME